MVYRLRRRDGEYRWIFDQGVPRFSEDGRFVGYIGSGVDITQHKLAEEVLSTVNRKLIAAQEEERARIARELHDDISQQIMLLGIDIEQLRQRGRLRRSADELADDAGDRLQHLARSVYDLTHRLHPAKLDVLGLVSGLSGLARELSRPDLTIAFEHHGVPAVLPPEITISLFRVVQEALQNAVKHSRAHHVSVQMSADSGAVVLTIADQGVGFDLDHVHRKGLGLVTMAERLQLIGGSLTITSRPGAGTRLQVRAPLPAATLAQGEAI